MKIDERWDELSDSDWRQFVVCWFDGLAEREEGLLPPIPKVIDEKQDAGDCLVQMNFTASHESQWKFIMAGSDPRFATMVDGCWQHKMSDNIWNRVQAIQNRKRR